MDNDPWLDKLREPIIDPERPICDPHHHLWDHPGSRYLLDELLADIRSGEGGGHNVVSTVFVECASMYRADAPAALAPVGETEFVNGIAAMTASGGYGPLRACAGIVGFADLTLGAEVGAVLDAHLARSDRFRGIRHASGWDADDRVRNSHTNPPAGLLEQPAFRAGIEALVERGLSFDAWLYHPQIPELTALARAHPDLTIVFDHFGGPLGIGPYAGRGAEVLAFWRDAVAELARCPNVYAKLGGATMAIFGHGFHKRAVPPSSDEVVDVTGHLFRYMLEQFGAERCMFESNFPVDRRGCSYHVLWNAFKKLAADGSPTEQSRLFHDTAVEVYRLAA